MAKKNFSDGFYPEAAARAYYAMFHSARALLLEAGIERVKHSAVISDLGKEIVKTGKMDAKFHKMIIKAKADREIADYDVYKEVDRALSEKRLKEAEEFLTEIKKLLGVA